MGKDAVFAWLTLDNDALRLYEQGYNGLALAVPVPDRIIYLSGRRRDAIRGIGKGDTTLNRGSVSAIWNVWWRPLSGFFFTLMRPHC